MKAHFILYVADQGRATRFYADVLQRAPVLEAPGMTEFELGPETILGLMPVAGIERLLPVQVADASRAVKAELYLHVDDVQAACTRAIAAGARSLSPATRRDWGDLAGYVMDPDGHVVAFAKRAPE